VVFDIGSGLLAPHPSLPDEPSAAISLPEALIVPLRRGEPAVVGRLEAGRLLLDLRSVPFEQDESLVRAILSAARCLP
jgi:L-seryl-tRNA(Ser) seleniumtransferase